jgi:tripartite-type tricarboxylate transporter receptor subunit TctC
MLSIQQTMQQTVQQINLSTSFRVAARQSIRRATLAGASLLACLLFLVGSTTGFAQEGYPSQPIHLVVGFPPGGQSDIMTRLIGDALAKQLNVAVVVENKGGASGIIGAEYVAHQKPDGYTLMVTSEAVQSRAAAVFKKLPYDPAADFTMIGQVARQKTLVVVNATSKFTTLKEFIAYAKANPGKINYASTFATTSQFAGALFGVLNHVDMVAVNYPGGAKLITDLMGGVVDVGFFVESTVVPQVQAGNLRALAVVSDEHSDLFPQIPTIREAGGAPMDVSPWFGVVGPANMPPAVVNRISGALTKMSTDPDFKQRLHVVGATAIEGSNPAAFTSEIKSEIVYWKKFVADTQFPLMD